MQCPTAPHHHSQALCYSQTRFGRPSGPPAPICTSGLPEPRAPFTLLGSQGRQWQPDTLNHSPLIAWSAATPAKPCWAPCGQRSHPAWLWGGGNKAGPQGPALGLHEPVPHKAQMEAAPNVLDSNAVPTALRGEVGTEQKGLSQGRGGLGLCTAVEMSLKRSMSRFSVHRTPSQALPLHCLACPHPSGWGHNHSGVTDEDSEARRG